PGISRPAHAGPGHPGRSSMGREEPAARITDRGRPGSSRPAGEPGPAVSGNGARVQVCERARAGLNLLLVQVDDYSDQHHQRAEYTIYLRGYASSEFATAC